MDSEAPSPPSISPSRIALAVLAISLWLTFANSLVGEFVYDDISLVRGNRHIRSLTAIPQSFVEFFRTKDISSYDKSVDIGYRPIRNSSYALDYFVTRVLFPQQVEEDLTPVVFHFTNILIHFLNALLLFFVLRRIFDSPWAALAGSLLFAVHPVQCESVTYISGRRDVLVGFFCLSAFWIYLARRPARFWPFLVVLLYICALLTKETAVVLPGVMIVHTWWHQQKEGNKSVREILGEMDKSRLALWVVLVVGALAFAGFKVFYKNPTDVGLAKVGYWGGSLPATVATIPRVIWFYLQLIAFPLHLSADYSHQAFSPSTGLFQPWTTPLAAVALGGLAYLIYRFRQTPLLPGAAWFFLFLLPVSQIVPHPERMGERFLYLPMVGIALALAGAFRWAEGKDSRFGALFVLALVAVPLMLRTHVRNRDWQSSFALWKSTVATYPQCARARLAWGRAQLERADRALSKGETKQAGQWLESALPEFERAREIADGTGSGRRRAVYLNALFWKGECLLKLGRYKQARRVLSQLYREKSGRGIPIGESKSHTHVHVNLAAAHYHLKDLSKARRLYEKAIELDPHCGPALLELGQMELEKGRRKRGETLLRKVISNSDISTSLREEARVRLAAHLANQRRFQEALSQVQPLKNSSNPRIQRLLGQIYTLMGQPKSALEALEKAGKENPQSLAISLEMANALLALKQYPRVEKILSRQREVNPNNPSVLVALMRLKLALEKPREVLALQPGPEGLTPDIHYHLGRAWEALNKPKTALKAYRHALEGGFHLGALSRETAIFLDREPPGEVDKIVKKRAKQFPNRWELPLMVGQTYLIHRHPQLARRQFQRCLDLKPGYGPAKKGIKMAKKVGRELYNHHLTQAREASRLGNRGEAITHLDRALKYFPNQGEAHEFRGRLYMKSGRPRQAIGDLRKALKLLDMGQTQAGLAWTRVARGHYQLEEYPEALEAARRAQKKIAKYPPAWKIEGLSLWNSGRKQKGRQVLEEFLKSAASAREKKELQVILSIPQGGSKSK